MWISSYLFFILFFCFFNDNEKTSAHYVYNFVADVENRLDNQDETKNWVRHHLSNAVPTFAFAKHFQSHMVLQQAPKRANVYGFSTQIGLKVVMKLETVPSTKQYYYITTVQQGSFAGLGVWTFLLDPFPGNTTVTISVQSNAGSRLLEDVIFGDVWLCSGQSNMQFTITQIDNPDEELEDAKNYPNIRLMTVNLNKAIIPLYDLIEIEENWTAPNRTTIGGSPTTYFSAVCWLFGKAIHKARGYPIGLVATSYGGSPAEAWSSPEALASCGNVDGRPEDAIDNSVLWNAMIHPLLNMTIYGAIWYQGEQDVMPPQMDKYNCTFPAMVKDWRLNFNKASYGQTSSDFPFGFVQLAAFQPDPSVVTGFPDIRWHQTADRGYVPNNVLPNVFMAVAMDLPDFLSPYGFIHPRYKRDVAARLALSGLSVAYGQPVMYQGPFPVHAEVTSQGLIVEYGDSWTLEVRDWSGFELLCGSSGWRATEIIDSSDTTVTLFLSVCSPGERLSGLRYAWRETPCAFKKCAIYENINYLPAPPFVALAQYNGHVTHFTFDGPTFV